MAKLVQTTYGDALFDLAVEESRVDALFDEAEAVIKAFDDNDELGKFLNHPKIKKEEKEEVIKNIFGEFVSKDMTGLLVIMVSKDRQAKIVDTLKYFEEKVKEYKKIGVVSDEQKERVESRLRDTTDYVSFEITYNVDESLIGGMVIRIGDRVVDSSIKTKIDEIAKNLKKIQLA